MIRVARSRNAETAGVRRPVLTSGSPWSPELTTDGSIGTRPRKGLQLAIHLAQMVDNVRLGVPPATRHLERADLVELAVRLFRESPVRGVLAVLNRVRDPATEWRLRELLLRIGPRVAGILSEDPAIQQQWLRGESLYSPTCRSAAIALARVLESAQREDVSAASPAATGAIRDRPAAR